MMSSAHIPAGAAAALVLAQQGSPESCLAAVVGGSVGGIIADCDVKSSRAAKDALAGRLAVAAIAAAVLAADRLAGTGLAGAVVSRVGAQSVAGVALLAALTFAGARSEHRSRTHSIAFMAAFSGAAWLVAPDVAPFFAAGYASHLALDLTNRRGMRLLWPARRRLCLGWFRADGRANAAIAAACAVAAASLLAFKLLAGPAA